MKIKFQSHLKIRLEQRKIPISYPKKVVIEPEEKYLDIETKHKIAVKRLKYGDKIRPMVVSYDIIGDTIEIITIHPISEQEIKNKLSRERWKHEEN